MKYGIFKFRVVFIKVLIEIADFNALFILFNQSALKLADQKRYFNDFKGSVCYNFFDFFILLGVQFLKFSQ